MAFSVRDLLLSRTPRLEHRRVVAVDERGVEARHVGEPRHHAHLRHAVARVGDRVVLEAHVHEIVAGDRYLISTDGLYKELTLESIRQMLSGPFNDQILQALIDEALNRGGRDNITGIVVAVGEQP